MTLSGLVYVSDKISQIPPGAKFGLGVPLAIHSLLRHISVEGGVIEGEERGERFVFYNISPDGGLLVVKQIFAGVVQSRADGAYIVSAPATPFLQGIQYSADTYIELPADAQLSNTPQGYTLNGTILSLRGSRPTLSDPPTLSFTFTSTTVQLLTIERLSLVYDLDSRILTAWLRIRNTDTRSLQSVTLQVPKGLRVVEAGDHTGQIRYTASGDTVTINIYPERFDVLSGWRYEFYIKALIQGDSDIVQISADTISLRTFQPANASIDSIIVEAVLPKNQAPTSTEKLEELYRDDAGRTVLRFSSRLLNPYDPQTLTIEVRSEGIPANVSQMLIAAILVLGVVGLITYSGAIPRRREKTGRVLEYALSQKLLKEFSELRGVLEEVDELVGLRRGDIKQVQVQAVLSRVRTKHESIRELLGDFKGDEMVQQLLRNLQSNMSQLGETLKVLGKSLTELQRGEMSRSSYLKIYRALRGDLRDAIAAVAESESLIRSISEKS